jgi:hypothetical protein
MEYSGDLISKFGYGHLFCPEKYANNTNEIENYNLLSLQKSIHEAKEADEITSIMVNYPALLLRKKSQLYPNGRTSYRFKRELRKLVTIIGKSAFDWDAVKGKPDLKKPVTFNEAD